VLARDVEADVGGLVGLRRAESSMLTQPPSSLSRHWSSAEERAEYLLASDAYGLYSQLGFLPADETVMPQPRRDDARQCAMAFASTGA
jgi:hypothetical protein